MDPATPAAAPARNDGSTRLVRTNWCVRTWAFAYCFATIGLVLWERQAGAGVWRPSRRRPDL